ncbi:MAG: 16S rRNA (cytosine(1402)-N(4))-methyltransferase RsmH [Rhodospirillaceae bacterium]|nr:16S rRNA (cytosine(1402)-N(4))-methyltransferase RsmH [Rhodospirillaceae bacterium]
MSDDIGHKPVMLAEVLEALAPRAGAVFVDATFGGGGYAEALLKVAPCRVWGIDQDPEAVARGIALARRYEERLTVLRGRFGEFDGLLASVGVEAIDGIAFDLGMSSQQVDTPERGFSFRLDGPLDMRMDPKSGTSAADIVNNASETSLADILFAFGEERAARRIARAIVRARIEAPILRTGQLAAIIHRVMPRAQDGQDPATRTFQALRIHVNDELGELDRGLHAAERLLIPGGRICVVAYHSLEDRRVKTFMRSRGGTGPRPSRHRPSEEGSEKRAPSLRLVHRRAVRPTAAEVAANPRARSARLRVAERTSAPPWPIPPLDRRAA